MALLNRIGELWKFAHRIEELFALNDKINAALEAVLARLDAIERRLLQLEADQRQFVTEARSASTGAATMIASSVVAEVVTRITRTEVRVDPLEEGRKALPPPSTDAS